MRVLLLLPVDGTAQRTVAPVFPPLPQLTKGLSKPTYLTTHHPEKRHAPALASRFPQRGAFLTFHLLPLTRGANRPPRKETHSTEMRVPRSARSSSRACDTAEETARYLLPVWSRRRSPSKFYLPTTRRVTWRRSDTPLPHTALHSVVVALLSPVPSARACTSSHHPPPSPRRRRRQYAHQFTPLATICALHLSRDGSAPLGRSVSPWRSGPRLALAPASGRRFNRHSAQVRVGTVRACAPPTSATIPESLDKYAVWLTCRLDLPTLLACAIAHARADTVTAGPFVRPGVTINAHTWGTRRVACARAAADAIVPNAQSVDDVGCAACSCAMERTQHAWAGRGRFKVGDKRLALGALAPPPPIPRRRLAHATHRFGPVPTANGPPPPPIICLQPSEPRSGVLDIRCLASLDARRSTAPTPQ